MADRDSRGPSTRVVHGQPRHGGGPVGTPILHSTTFEFASVADLIAARDQKAAGAFYQRLGHPTLNACEERLAALESAEQALLFSSGMAAISSVMLAHVKAGDRVVAMQQCYGGTLDVLHWGSERFGWSVELLDARNPRGWEAALAKRPKLLHVESPTNPTLCVVDIAEAAKLAHRHGALLSVDNTVASPLGQSPLQLGADLVLYSATKSIGGHSDLLAGVALGASQVLEPVWHVRHVFGGVPDPSVAWLVERSLMTLALRVERMNANAAELARRLAQDPRVARVFHPSLESHPGHEIARRQMRLGFGSLLAFEVRGGAFGAETVSEALAVAKNAPSLGSVHTLVSLPIHTSHRKMTSEQRAEAGIPDGLVRVSAGIEDLEDLWKDFDRALAMVGMVTARG